MPSRRAFLSGLLASGIAPNLTWADAGNPTHIGAAQEPDLTFSLYGIRGDGSLSFRIPLPGRGHAAAAHPARPEAVAFARRPGRFALVLDCVSGRVTQTLDAPAGRHFYGHGAFSQDGTRLFTTENDVETGAGVVGIWAREEGYARIGEFPSGGIGPHEIIRLPGSEILAVANGGIRTHPDTGREKLNLDTMRPNLLLFGETGSPIEQAELSPELHQNSLRHIAANPAGEVACAFQWQGDVFEAPPLLAIYTVERGLTLAKNDEAEIRALNGYAGSVSYLADGSVVITSPRGGVLQIYDPSGEMIAQHGRPDICGVAKAKPGGLASDGGGQLYEISGPELTPLTGHNLAFDNHLVAI